MNPILFLLAFCAGIAISVQAAVNSQLAAGIGGNSVVAALVSFIVGTAALAIMGAAQGGLDQALSAIPAQPLWTFAGGILGAAFVFGTVYLAPRIGLVSLLVLVIAGQLLTSMVIDNFGLIHMAVRQVTPIRAFGALVMAVGVALILAGDRLVAALSR